MQATKSGLAPSLTMSVLMIWTRAFDRCQKRNIQKHSDIGFGVGGVSVTDVIDRSVDSRTDTNSGEHKR